MFDVVVTFYEKDDAIEFRNWLDLHGYEAVIVVGDGEQLEEDG